MGLISKNNKEIADELVGKYTCILMTIDISETEAVRMARKIIKIAQEAMARSTRKMSSNLGKKIIRGSGFSEAYQFRRWLYKEKTQDEDILWWWSLPELERWVRIKFDDFQIERARHKLEDKGVIRQDIDLAIARLFPIFDFIDEIGDSSFPDRALPHEMRLRVERWITRQQESPRRFLESTDRYSSMNAYIRDEIKKKML